MKKKAFALAMLALAAGAASAQSTVTAYGIIDLGLVVDGGAPQGKSVRISSGADRASRLGFRGVEDLGDGLKTGFVLETGFCADSAAGAPNFCSANNQFMGRQARVDLIGSFGTLSAGRQYTFDYQHLTLLDPFGAGYAGKANNVIDASSVRLNNSVRYATPTISGFTGGVEVALGETTGNWKANREEGAEVTYSSGPAYAGVTYYDFDNANGIGSQRNETLFGGTYDFGIVKVHAMGQKSSGAPTGGVRIDALDLLGGVTVPIAGGALMASYLNHDDRSIQNRDASQWGLGYSYPLSKRTSAYASFARIENQHGATFTVGNNTETGTGNKAFDVGVLHNF
jgi:predicted porin